MTRAFTGISGKVPVPVPLMFVHVADVSVVATAPCHTCEMRKADITTITSLTLPGRATMSQIYWFGKGDAWIAVAVQLPPLFAKR